MEEMPQCAKCAILCNPNIPAGEKPSFEKAPAFCPSVHKMEVIEKALKEYDKEEIAEFARLASVQEFECYEQTPEGRRTKLPRIEEIMEFAKKNDYHKLGLAFCGGLAFEARMVADIFEAKGFELVSVCCKTGGIPKERIGIKPEEKIRGPKFNETMCNPISQAEILNSEKVDLAILMGLCVGHDSLFIKYCKAPLTVLAVKDRVMGHNPLAAVYLSRGNYYGHLRAKPQ